MFDPRVPAAIFAIGGLLACDGALAQKRPEDIGHQLTDICRKAGYSSTQLDRCAAAFEKHCQKAKLDPKSERCWRRLLEQDDRRTLDYDRLRNSR